MALESAVAPTSLYEPVFSDGEDSFSVMDQLRDKTRRGKLDQRYDVP